MVASLASNKAILLVLIRRNPPYNKILDPLRSTNTRNLSKISYKLFVYYFKDKVSYTSNYHLSSQRTYLWGASYKLKESGLVLFAEALNDFPKPLNYRGRIAIARIFSICSQVIHCHKWNKIGMREVYKESISVGTLKHIKHQLTINIGQSTY